MRSGYAALISAAIISLSMTAPSVFPASAAGSELVIDSNFDSGEIGEWSSFGGGSLALDNERSQSGGYSIRITDRGRIYHGPSIRCDKYLIPGESYDFDGWIYHEGSETISFNWTMKFTNANGEDDFMQITTSEVPPNEWFELKGTDVTVPAEASSCTIYFESSSDNIDFNVDTVTVKGKRPDTTAGKKTFEDSYDFDFESDTQGWIPRGAPRVIHTDEFAHDGKYSIYCSNRSAVWEGPQRTLNDMVEKGESYFYTAYVMYNGEEYEDSHVFRLEVQYTFEGSDHYDLVCSKELKKGKWTELSGFHTVPEGAVNVSMYVQTANLDEGVEKGPNDLMSFYVDDVNITRGKIIVSTRRKRIIMIAAVSAAAAAAIIALLAFMIRRMKRNTATIENASIDAMTRMLNRNAYEERVDALEKSPESCKGLWFALCDVNFMKYINDNFGHDKGDEAIRRCASMIKRAVGKNGDVYRVGGDEFICITKTDISEALRAAVKAESDKDKGYPFKVACGFAQIDGKKITDIRSAVNRCDREMYEDKNRIKMKNADFSRK